MFWFFVFFEACCIYGCISQRVPCSNLHNTRFCTCRGLPNMLKNPLSCVQGKEQTWRQIKMCFVQNDYQADTVTRRCLEFLFQTNTKQILVFNLERRKKVSGPHFQSLLPLPKCKIWFVYTEGFPMMSHKRGPFLYSTQSVQKYDSVQKCIQ